ncbi:MAG: histidine kinase dimerization/phosphoacceptor domain -containing protein [Acetobacteraceae bacterium]|nr:histidine kinase dimerization/phosphoacceptor domain -containing protein [Acetobacteraceae bacterium]
MRIMPKADALEAFVLGLSEQSYRHQSAIALLADRALGDIELDALLLEACQLCADVLDVPAVRVLEFRDACGLALRCAARRDTAAVTAEPRAMSVSAGGGSLGAGFAVAGGMARAGGSMKAGALKPRVLASASAMIDDGLEQFGVLELDCPYTREFSEPEVDFIAAIARLLGRAVARTRERDALRQANDALAAEAEEARMLLRELSHRVRNDLQMLEAQTYLEARNTQDPASRQGFGTLARRVMALAALYDHLLATHEPQLVAFDDYLSMLCVRVQDAQDLAGRDVVLELSTQPVWLSQENAVGFGIATNELIANAAEHAFVGRSGGRIRLQLAQAAPGSHRASLTIADDGRGAEGPEGDGMTFVRRLIGHHGGTVHRMPGPGTNWRIEFPCA